jgi:competence protein ComEC
MTLGDKSALSRELRDTYSVTGASHVLALSGLHLGILYMLLSFLLQSRYRQRVWSQAVLVLSIWAFALLVGLPVSVVRSATMISLFAIFSVGHRPHLSVNLLCLAALVILLQNPYALFDVGFQLSFVSVASILLLLPLFTPDPLPQAERAPAPSLFRRFTTAVVGLLAVSLVAQVGVAPLIAYYFGRFSTYFLLTNLIVLPAAYLILCGSLLMLLVPIVAPAVLWIVGSLNRLLSVVVQLPLSSIDDLHPSWVQVVVWYLLVASLSGAVWVWRGRWSWS